MYLLDTNVISEIRKIPSGKANPQLTQWAQNCAADEMFVSVITLMELHKGILSMKRKDAMQGEHLQNWFQTQVLPSYQGRILPITTEIALRCGALHVPNPQPAFDSLIAATALVHNLIVVTQNIRDFDSTGVNLINPFI